MKAKQNFSGFLSSYSETARKLCAGLCMACAALVLFFAWSAKITARFPVLGAGENPDFVGTQSAQAATLSDSGFTKGLAESIKDAVGVLKDSIFFPNKPAEPGTTSTSESEPLHELFNTISDEPSAPEESTVNISSHPSTSLVSGAEGQSTSVQENDAPPSDEPLPPIENLPVP